MLIVENLNALHDELNSHRDVDCTEGLRLVQLRIHAQQQWPSSGSPAAGIAIFAPVVHSRRGCSHPVSGRPSRHLQEAHHFRICRPSAVPVFISSSSKLTLRTMYALEIWKLVCSSSWLETVCGCSSLSVQGILPMVHDLFVTIPELLSLFFAPNTLGYVCRSSLPQV